MASLSPMKSIPVRSISLPSRSHPNSLKIEAQLTKLRAWESSTNPLSADTIQMSLTKLAELFNCIPGTHSLTTHPTSLSPSASESSGRGT
ncbi:hypothetical protein NC652_019058 [Populus alba x Populus x berolinensis]|nr:hypothetical protein NC652_019058 [Populus alba x Populus x berolinensis]